MTTRARALDSAGIAPTSTELYWADPHLPYCAGLPFHHVDTSAHQVSTQTTAVGASVFDNCSAASTRNGIVPLRYTDKNRNGCTPGNNAQLAPSL
jgi:hypothetical protein